MSAPPSAKSDKAFKPMLNSPKKPPLVAFGVRADSSGKKPASTIKQGKGKETTPPRPKEQRVQFDVTEDGDSEEQAGSEEERDREEEEEREQEQDHQQEQEQLQEQEREQERESKERASRGPTQSLWEHSQVHVHISNSQTLPSPSSPNILLFSLLSFLSPLSLPIPIQPIFPATYKHMAAQPGHNTIIHSGGYASSAAQRSTADRG
jgi:cell division protein FtsN